MKLNNDAKIACENDIKVVIRVIGEGANAALLLCCNQWRPACTVYLKWRRRAVQVTAAIELDGRMSSVLNVCPQGARKDHGTIPPGFDILICFSIRTRCCNKLLTRGVCCSHTTPKLDLVLNVSNHMANPRPRVNVAEATTNQACSFSHRRLSG